MLEQWQCSPHRMRAVRRRIYAAHLTVCRGIIEQLEHVEIDAFPTAFITIFNSYLHHGLSIVQLGEHLPPRLKPVEAEQVGLSPYVHCRIRSITCCRRPSVGGILNLPKAQPRWTRTQSGV
jgi:hypothetical protein